MLLQWSGWLHHAEVVLQPLIGWLGLPSEAALPIISGMVINIYAAIATMTVIPFSTAQMTLIAVFVLIAHNLFMEGIIQHRSGMNGIRITLVRIASAVGAMGAEYRPSAGQDIRYYYGCHGSPGGYDGAWLDR